MTARPRRLIVRIEDTTREAVRDGHTVRLDAGAVLETHPVADGMMVVSEGPRRRIACAAASADERWVFVDGEVFVMEVTDVVTRARERRAKPAGALTAPMPATVLRIFVEPGARVSRGDVLLVLEAMKMELPVRAGHDGTITALHCREGELVQPDVALLTLE